MDVPVVGNSERPSSKYLTHLFPSNMDVIDVYTLCVCQVDMGPATATPEF